MFFPFPEPRVEGVIVNRRKRFLADIVLADNREVTAHCPNSGSMRSCWQPGRSVVLTDHGPKANRKLRYTLQAVRMPDGWVGVNTMNPNRFVEHLLLNHTLPYLAGYAFVRREFPFGASRFDFVLWDPRTTHPPFPDIAVKKPEQSDDRLCLVEVKNVTLRTRDGATFPDAVTTRGQKHLRHLQQAVQEGHRAVMLYFVGRSRSRWAGFAADIDPDYALAAEEARNAGVEFHAIGVQVGKRGLTLRGDLPIRWRHDHYQD